MTETPTETVTPASLANDRVLIIGGSSGMGLATAQAVSDTGGEVIIAGRSAEKRDEARAAVDGTVEAYEVDLADPATIDALFETVESIDHLVLTAAYVPNDTYDDLADEDFRQAFAVKFWGYYHAANRAQEYLNDDGSITFTSGNAATKPAPEFFAVGIVNAAVETLAQYLAVEFSPLRVNAVSPGLTDTYGMSDEERASVAESTLVDRPGEPADIAQAIMFAMTNPNVSGAVLPVDGGSTLL